jgi:hypothetical protein
MKLGDSVPSSVLEREFNGIRTGLVRTHRISPNR